MECKEVWSSLGSDLRQSTAITAFTASAAITAISAVNAIAVTPRLLT